ncbi:MAG: site-specific DNA-methyltransferase [Thermotogae bacterium]|jgi:adenine-specific DNA-methyltransferase|nr:site-specific DNA-methyltransferase [Thermotogota bacterium]
MDIDKVNKMVKIDFKESLKKALPEIFEDGKINLEKLKSLLGDEFIEKEDDRFYFNWADKRNIFKLIQTPAYGTLKPDREKSVDFEKTENIVIVGENLETLKLLLKPYFGRVKMIYIDPPYNTGKDFIYNDNFDVPLRDYLEKTGQIDSDGKKLTTNTEASGRYHSDWLNFIYPRLFLARNLLRDDGVIFVSIDDNEVHHLRMIMDEIFGEDNFVSEFCWKSRGGRQDSKYVAVIHEYILLYRKSNLFMVGEMQKEGGNYPYFDEVRNRRYKRQLARKWGSHSHRWERPNLFYSLIAPDGTEVEPRLPNGEDGCWRWSKKKMEEEIKNCSIEFVKEDNQWVVYEKIYEPKEGEIVTKKFTTWLDDVNNIAYGTNELSGLFSNKPPFSFPKSTILIERLLSIANTVDNSIILDFFAGSGTTGQALWALNKEDGGDRKFILFQLDEPVGETKETGKNALSLGLKTVADICIERLRRASEKYKGEIASSLAAPRDGEKGNSSDFGFKVFRLDKSNFNLKDEFKIPVEEDIEDLKQKYLNWLGAWIDQSLVHGVKNIDVVYEIMLKEGFNLNSKVEELQIKNTNFYHIQDIEQELDFYVSLDEEIDKKTIEEIRTAKYRNKTFIFLDKSLTDDDKINLTAFIRLKVI